MYMCTCTHIHTCSLDTDEGLIGFSSSLSSRGEGLGFLETCGGCFGFEEKRGSDSSFVDEKRSSLGRKEESNI